MPVGLDNWRAGIGLFNQCKFITSPRVSLAEFPLPLLNCFLYCYLLIIIAPIIAVITIITVSAFSHVQNLLFLLFPKFAIKLIDYKFVMVNFYQYAVVTVYFVIYEIFYVSTRTLSFILRITTKLRYLDLRIILIISLHAYLRKNAQLDYFQCNIFTDNYFVILICGDVHPHPGPSHENSLKFCHWNLDSIAVNDFIKIPLIEAYNSVYNYDLIALSETYLDSSISNGTISLTGFSKEIFRCDHPDDVKRGGVCLFYKDNLAIKQRKDLQVMDECIISELTIVSITEDKIVNIIRKLNSNKAHGCDNMSIRMLKICDTTIAEPLKLIYEKCLDTGRYPRLWKKAIIVPAHKKNSRQILKNYRPISLLPICGKIFEKIIFDEIYEHLTATKLLSEKQSGFRPGDSTINQLLSITHEIYHAFEHHHDTRAVFLDISKAFDKVWHEGLLLKLRSNGISGPLLNLLSEFLSERYQRTVLNGKSSDWRMITAGVPQGSVLGPLLFLVYINDLADNLISDVRLFADDTSLFHVVTDADISADVLNHDLRAIENWAFQWKMSFNPDPTKQAEQVIFSSKSIRAVHPPIYFNNSAVVTVPHHKHIGLVLDESLTFAEHIKEAVIKARRGIGIIRFMARYVHRDVLDQMYKLYVRPHLDYGDIIYHNQNLHLMSKLESTQYDAALAVSGAWRGTNTDKVLEELGWETLAHRRWYRRLCQFYKIENNSSPEYLKNHLPERRENPYNLRRPNIFPEVRAKTNRYSNSFYPYCIKAWNNLDPAIRCLPTISQFKKAVVQLIRPRKKHLFGIDDIAGTRLLTRLRVDFSDLRLHKFNHRFNCDSPMCTCGRGLESVEHFFLQCQFYADQRSVLIDSVSEVIGNEVQVYPEQHLCCIFLYGSESFNSVANKMILESTIRYIKDSKRFKI